MRVATNSGHTLYPKVERLRRVACCLEEWHDETAQAAIDVKSDVVLGGELAKRYNIVLASVWEIDGRSYELVCM